MKVVTTYLHPRYSGIVNAFQHLVGSVSLWRSELVPVFDFFDTVKPDVLLVGDQVITPSLIEVLENTDAKVVFFGDSVPEGIEPDLVCSQPSLTPLMKKHLDHFDPIYVKDFVDTTVYLGGDRDETLACEVGSMFPNTNLNMDLLKFLLRVSANYKFKIVGENNLAIPSFLGNLPMHRRLDFMKSCTIFLDINGTQLLECAANSVFAVSTVSNTLYPHITYDNCMEVLSTYLVDEEKRLETARIAKINVLSQSTGYHEAINIIQRLDLGDELVEKAEEEIEEALK